MEDAALPSREAPQRLVQPGVQGGRRRVNSDVSRHRPAVGAHLHGDAGPAHAGFGHAGGCLTRTLRTSLAARALGAQRGRSQRGRVRQQDQGVSLDLVSGEQLARAYDDLVGGRTRGDDVTRLAIGCWAGQAQSLALADGEAEVALVRAQDLTVRADQRALLGAERALEEATGVAVGHKADVIGVRLVRYRQPALGGLRAHGSLRGGITQGKERSGQALTSGDSQHVGLVLGSVSRAGQAQVVGVSGASRARAPGEPGVVAGGHGVEAHRQAALQQGVKLDPLVAAYAGVGSAPGTVLGQEIGDDPFLELLRQVPHVEGDAEDLGGPACVRGVLDRAAPA